MGKVPRIVIAVMVGASTGYAYIGGQVANSDLLCQMLLFFCGLTVAAQLIPCLILVGTLARVFREKQPAGGWREKGGRNEQGLAS